MLNMNFPLNGGPSVPPAFQGQRASYVALASITTLGLALLSSIWASDVSGSTAVMGLFAIYLASSELLLLYAIFSPSSVIIDIIRLSVSTRGVHGRGWLIFFTVCEMLAKLVGGALAWSLHRSASQGEVPYQPVTQTNAGGSSGSGGPGAYARMPASDPFAAYQPPQPDSLNPPLSSTYQPFPSSQPAGVTHA
ncbi:hypothetical protein VOLCADRAFT_104795 [Volvox carteri f. nagariensis]|uniref:Uncharacterized protein n=1 Tax=Volvox carteri f. nagariensis TaxID=3068 RepID=D8TW38_VOLCA|nr:uncharacterized protein VOLCADRAFT_104795 [Volvox carteri f. nagariensis]EFJ48411.1 hypothetical protein VOLCADRAFT_104795 [Volvox carteri f. nagariensis]|eukprot:XP_002950665.1 hypothetical protein VOLCADRAFT_104795 [Volvox carteri f. nagariensis]